jgi:hypothetical protein
MRVKLITHRHRFTTLVSLRKNLAAAFTDGPLSPLAVYRHNRIAGFVLTPQTYVALLLRVQQVDELQNVERTRIPKAGISNDPNVIFVKPPTTGTWWVTKNDAIDRAIAHNIAESWHELWEQINCRPTPLGE